MKYLYMTIPDWSTDKRLINISYRSFHSLVYSLQQAYRLANEETLNSCYRTIVTLSLPSVNILESLMSETRLRFPFSSGICQLILIGDEFHNQSFRRPTCTGRISINYNLTDYFGLNDNRTHFSFFIFITHFHYRPI